VSLLNDTKGLLKELIAFPTVSTDSNIELIEWIGNKLEKLGADVEILKDKTGNKANLFATLGPTISGGIVFSGHSDVVPVTDQDWTSDPFEMIERDGKLYGRGTCDMKGFIAATLAMAPHYAQLDLKRPVHFAFTHDEEIGCIGGIQLVKDLANKELKPSIAIIGEPTDMRVIEGHKGCCEYTTHFVGLEGHGSTPDTGVNAAEYATRYVMKLMHVREQLKMRTPPGSQFEPPETTINIGAVHGGVAHNVIAGKAYVDWEMRPVQTSDGDFVKTQINDYVHNELLPAMQSVYAQSSINTHCRGEVLGLEPLDVNTARDLIQELTGANGTDLVSFSTEAGLFQSLGMDVVVCGPGSIAQAHKPDEYIAIEQLEQCLQLLYKLKARLV